MSRRTTTAHRNSRIAAATDAASAELLAWYDRHARVLPWRARPPERPDPYRVWLAEIMLQQTTVATVGPYFREFVARWPSVHDLAAAPLDEVLTAWAGLGYYARARNLHKCAQVVVRDYGGRFPDTEDELRRLPGIGPYTAAAIAAIAFDRPAVVVDGNVERVMSRVFAIETPLPAAKPAIRAAAALLAPTARTGDYAQALMDLGATICTPRAPRCILCPWSARCAARRLGTPETFPRKAAKAVRPQRHGVAFLLLGPDGSIWLRRRPERGLLGGMMEVPSTDWTADAPSRPAARRAAPCAADWRELEGHVSHGFTHFDLSLKVWIGRAPADAVPDGAGLWVPIDRLGDVALPTLMRKVIAHGLAGAAVPHADGGE